MQNQADGEKQKADVSILQIIELCIIIFCTAVHIVQYSCITQL